MSTKTIEVKQVTNILGKPMRVPATDDKGDTIWVNPEEPIEAKRSAQMADATVLDMLRVILFSIPESISKNDDALRAPALFNRMDRVENGVIKVHEKVYNWFHNLLARPIPVSTSAQEQGSQKHSYAISLWGVANSAWVVNQLKAQDEQKPKEELFGGKDTEDEEEE